MKRQKILYVITKSEPYGGAQKYVYDLATRLPAEQFDVVVALGGNGSLKQKLEKIDIRTITIPSLQRDVHFGKELLALWSLYTVFKDEQPDIVHLNSSKAGGLGTLVGRITPVRRIVFTSHGLPFEEDRRWLSRLVIRFFTWLTFLFAHHIILISKRTLECASRMPFVRHKLSLVYNAVEKTTYKERNEARQSIAQKINLPETYLRDEMFWVGTIAELHKNKGLTYLVESIETMIPKEKSVILIIISEGELRETLEALIIERNLSEHVFLTGYMQNAAELVKAFDVFALTSIKEGHPYTLLEAGMANVPVVGSNIPGISDIIDDMKNGMLVKPKRPDEIAEALLYMHAHPEQRRRFALALAEKMTCSFRMNDMLKHTMAAYRAEM